VFETIPAPKILHICGNVDPIVKWMGRTGSDILSYVLSPRQTPLGSQKMWPRHDSYGGVDTATILFMKGVDTVKVGAEESIASAIQILASGCAVALGRPWKIYFHGGGG
jgi:[methyl-Co(III) methanol-specific corrinoid protein]:coenzyme M methyltransferase